MSDAPFEVRCMKCEATLRADVSVRGDIVRVEPCATCMVNAEERAYDEGVCDCANRYMKAV